MDPLLVAKGGTDCFMLPRMVTRHGVVTGATGTGKTVTLQTVQHALRAFTPRDQKAVKAAADTFRQNPAIDITSVVTELGVGEALLSFLDEKGMPSGDERRAGRRFSGCAARAQGRHPHRGRSADWKVNLK